MRRGGVDDVNTTLTNPGKEGRPGVADPVQDAAPTVDLVSKDLDRHEAWLGFLWLAGEVVEMAGDDEVPPRSEEHTSELQSLMRISYAVFCLKKKKTKKSRLRRQV